MRRSGTGFRGRSTAIWPCLLCLFGSACGDSVVVAREFSLVSAAVESQDAGSDADQESDGPHFNLGHGGSGPFVPHPSSHLGVGGSSSKDPHANSGSGGSGTGGSGSSGSGSGGSGSSGSGTGGGGSGGSSAKSGTSNHL